MTPQSRWGRSLLLIGILGIAGVVLIPILHHPDASQSSRKRATAFPPGPVPTFVPAAPIAVGAREANAVPPLAPFTLASSPQDRRVRNWTKRFPGEVLPYSYTGGGPQPGPPKQQLSGFSLTARASDAPNPLGQSLPAPAARPPQILTMLTATTAEPSVKDVFWELNQNGLSVEGDSRMNSAVAGAEFRPGGRGSQAANIIQSLKTGQDRHPKHVIIHGVLRQHEDCEEALTFRTPAMGGGGAGQTDWQSQETPSGVKVSLLPQAMSAAGGPGSGGNDILRLGFQIAPAQTPVSLPRSPLSQKYHQPVLLRVGAMTPRGAAYDYPFSDPQSVMSLYKEPNQAWQYGSSPDVLTLVVQQRVYIREIPFALSVPVSHLPFGSFDTRAPVRRRL